jgi:hypothetical protein
MKCSEDEGREKQTKQEAVYLEEEVTLFAVAVSGRRDG